MSFVNKKIYVAGHQGMVGSALIRVLKKNGYTRIVTRTKEELNLLNTDEVKEFFSKEKPEIVILAAARVGGILANMKFPADFLFENLVIQNNVIHNAFIHNVEKFCFLGSSCIYPRNSKQPIKEEYLLTGPLELTNEGYALAKISGLKMIQYYKSQYGFNGISLMPCNLYGTNDSFDLEHAHVLSSLVKKIVDAFDENRKEVVIWGTGVAQREFMHVDDAAEAILYLLNLKINETLINVGVGEDISILNLAKKISSLVGFSGKLTFDKTKSDGMLKKCLDVSKMNSFGFFPKISLDKGILNTIEEYRKLKGIVK